MSKHGEKKRNKLWKLIFWLFYLASMCVSSTYIQQPGFLIVYFRYVCWLSINTQINFIDAALELTYLVH